LSKFIFKIEEIQKMWNEFLNLFLLLLLESLNIYIYIYIYIYINIQFFKILFNGLFHNFIYNFLETNVITCYPVQFTKMMDYKIKNKKYMYIYFNDKFGNINKYFYKYYNKITKVMWFWLSI